MRQLITAELNISAGATASADVMSALNSMRSYFAGNSVPDLGALTQTLDDFNNGIAPGSSPHCDD